MKAILLNAAQLDFDGRLDLAPLEEVIDVVRYETTDRDQLAERVRDCHVVISKEYPLPDEVVQDFPDGVRLICEAGTGFNNIGVDAAKARNIVVCNVPGYSTSAVAQLAIGFVLWLSTSMHRIMRGVALHDLEDFQKGLRFPHLEVQDKTLGVIGAGAIGSRVIQLARALDMNVLVFNRSPRSWDDPAIRQVSLEELLPASDFVTLHVPLTEITTHLMNASTLRAMKRGACLVNVSRGGLVDHDALLEALESEHLSGAALDVQEPEPLPLGSRFWSMENVILTPHIGWKATEARQRLVGAVADNIAAFFKGSPRNVVA